MIKIYLDLNTLNKQNDYIWSSFVNFVKEDLSYELVVDEDPKNRDWLNNRGCNYVTYNESIEISWMISYLSAESKDKNVNNTIFLIDSKNARLLERMHHFGEINIASLSTKNELQISNNIKIGNFILIIFQSSKTKNICNSKRVLISNNSNCVTKSIENLIDLKIPTSELYLNNDLIYFNHDDSTIIYDGEQAYELHSLINSNKSSFIKNLNTSLQLSVNRLSFDFNTELYHFFIQSKTQEKRSLRNFILDLFETTKINQDANFVSLSEQLNNDFQNFIKTIDHFESKQFNYLNKFGNIDLLLAIKVSKFKKNTSKSNVIQSSLFSIVFERITNNKFPINHSFNILQYLFSVDKELLVSEIERNFRRLQNTNSNDLVLNHMLWFYSSKFSFRNTAHKDDLNNIFLSNYSKLFDDIIVGKYAEIVNCNLNKNTLLLYVYSNLVFNSLENILKNWSRINLIFQELSENSSYKRINLIHEMYSNNFNYTNPSFLSSYGGITAVRNVLYQYLYMSITNRNIKLFKFHKKLVQSTCLNDSFDSLFSYTFSLHSLDTSYINNLSMDTNPWFDSNQLYCIIYCYKIFIHSKCNSGLQIVDSISEILGYKIPKTFDVFKRSDITSVNINDFEKLLLHYSMEYYDFIK